MITARNLDALPRRTQGVTLAIGMFDGVHLGHRHVIESAIESARLSDAVPVAITYDPHPLAVVNPERAPRLVQSLNHRLRSLEKLGVQATVVQQFDPVFASKSGEDYIRELWATAGRIRSISIGSGFHFGRGRSGNVDLLRRLGVTLGYSVNSIPSVTAGGEVISSSLIRQNIRNGDLGRVKELLGRHYSICGVVEKGDQLGRNLGFPTANLGVEGLELPPSGVYSATVLLGTQQVRAVLNLGYRPTLNVPTPLLRFEVHILDFDGDLYGREIEVFPEQKLRDELRFPSVGALKEQISRDIAHARTLVSSTRPADLEARSGLQATGTITTR